MIRDAGFTAVGAIFSVHGDEREWLGDNQIEAETEEREWNTC